MPNFYVDLLTFMFQRYGFDYQASRGKYTKIKPHGKLGKYVESDVAVPTEPYFQFVYFPGEFNSQRDFFLFKKISFSLNQPVGQLSL